MYWFDRTGTWSVIVKKLSERVRECSEDTDSSSKLQVVK